MPRLVAVNGERHLDTATTLRNLGIALNRADRFAEAHAAFDRSRRIFSELVGEDHEMTARVDHDKARLLMSEDRWAEAEPFALRALEIFAASVGIEDPRHVAAAKTLVEIYEQLGREADAARYRD
jgi:tetratricopeptide (TPR) repeat protein